MKNTIENLAILQLVNGENIIGPILEHGQMDTHVAVGYPMSLMLDPVSGGLGMMPYLAIYTGSLSDDRSINKRHIISILEQEEITPEITEKYAEYKKQVLDSIEKEKQQKQPKQPTLFDTEEEGE